MQLDRSSWSHDLPWYVYIYVGFVLRLSGAVQLLDQAWHLCMAISLLPTYKLELSPGSPFTVTVTVVGSTC